jgi:copper type II ascorbate-dependent monooxygenase-like protein
VVRLALLLLALTLPALAASPTLKKPRKGRGFQMSVSPYTVAPNQDLEVCEYRRLPNKHAMDISAFKLSMPPGAHHFVIWLYGGSITDDSAFPKGPVPGIGCTGLAPDDNFPVPLVPLQQPNATFHFPKGIAFRIDAHDQVWLNPHMKNLGDTPIVPDIRFNLLAAKKGSVQHIAHGVVVGNMNDIRIPAGGDQTLTAEWTSPADLMIVDPVTHQHRLGTYANIEVVGSDGVPNKIYESTSWEHPPPFPHPPFLLKQGDKLRITCTWHNTDDHLVTFGPKTTDEMCFILGYYYRDGEDLPIPDDPQCFPGARQALFCPFARPVAQ